MNQYIQPLADILKLYPELSAKVIVIASGIFTTLAWFYVYLQEQAKYVLKEKAETQKSRADTCEDEKRYMSEQIEMVQGIAQSRRDLVSELNKLSIEMENLKRKNFDLENMPIILNNLSQLKTMIEMDVDAITQAIATQDDRRQFFIKAQEEQEKKGWARFVSFIKK